MGLGTRKERIQFASLQHQSLEVFMEDGVPYCLKHISDVVRVHSGREIVEQRLAAVPAPHVKHLEDKVLDVLQAVRIALEVGKVVLNADMFDLLLQQVRFVQEEDDGDGGEALVVDDGVKDVAGLDEAVGDAVLHEDLVELAGRRQEQDGCHALEALKPLLPLRPLAADVDEAEGHVPDVDDVFLEGLGGLAGVQDIIQAGGVVLFSHSINFIQEVLNGVSQLKFSSPVERALNPTIFPQFFTWLNVLEKN